MTWKGVMSWDPLPVAGGPSPRLGHTATLVGERRVYVMGGREGDTFMNDVWTFDCESEEWACVASHAPFCPRAYATATLVKGRYIWVIGGSSQFDLFSDIHVLDTRTHTWSIPPLQGEPLEVAAHGAVLHPSLPDSILIFGGYARVGAEDNDFTNHVYIFHTDSPRFEQLKPAGRLPLKLGYHTLTALGNRVFSFGGKNKEGRLKQQLLSVYDVAANAWLDVITKGLGPTSRSGHSATAVEGNAIMIYGGRSGTQRLADFFLLQVVPPGGSKRCSVQWHPLPGTACGNLELTDTHPGGRAAHTLIARKRALYVFGGYGGDKLTYGHPYVLRYLPNLDSPEDLVWPPPRRISPAVLRKRAAEVLPPHAKEGAGWRSSKRAGGRGLRQAAAAATAAVGSVMGESQPGGEGEEQTSPPKEAGAQEGTGKRKGVTEGGAVGKRRKVSETVPESQAASRETKQAAAEEVARRANERGDRPARARRRGVVLDESSSEGGGKSPVQGDITETQSAADRGGRAGVSRRGWQAPHGKHQQEEKQQGHVRDRRTEEKQCERMGGEEKVTEAFSFPCNSEDESLRGTKQRKRTSRKQKTPAKEAAPKEQKARTPPAPPAKAALPVKESTGLADFEREHYAGAVAKLEREKEVLQQLLQDKADTVAHLAADKRSLAAERDGLAHTLSDTEARLAAVREEAGRSKQERATGQADLEETKRLLAKSERQRTSSEAEVRSLSVKLEEAQGRLAETSLRREALEGTARQLETELGKEQQRALEARQSHERERATLNQVAHERAAEKEALRVKVEQTCMRNDQLQETVSTLTRELADWRAQVKEAQEQAGSLRTALSQAKTDKVQLEAAKDAAERTCAGLSAEVGRLRAHSEKLEAEEARARAQLLKTQGQREQLQAELREAQAEAARTKGEVEKLRIDAREHVDTAEKVEQEARQLTDHAQQIRALCNRQLRLRPGGHSMAQMSEET